ncbi:MAG: hypothetical protein WC214_04820 [Candidatus Omnitrophota bacterium]|nr:hypothetical protein [Candidatus Omnitrophota bacterium]
MFSYIKPKITFIELEPEQAILQTCQSNNGIWMSGTLTASGVGECIIPTAGPGGIRTCSSGFRGAGASTGYGLPTPLSPGS